MNNLNERPVKIENAKGEKLDGLLWLACDESTGRAVIVCHPHPAYGGTMYNNVVAAVVQKCIAQGISTLRFNYSTTGAPQATEGGRGETEDLLAAISYFIDQLENQDDNNLSLIGYSFGALVSLNAASQSNFVDKVFAIAPPVSHMAMEGVGNFDKPKYFIHGLRDSYGTPKDFEAWFEKLPQPKQALTLDVDHFYRGTEPLVASHIVEKLLE
jgi:alpha/beta superfamily hydrolase